MISILDKEKLLARIKSLVFAERVHAVAEERKVSPDLLHEALVMRDVAAKRVDDLIEAISTKGL